MINTQIDIENPFVGLRSFTEQESHLFFGREQQVDELLLRLRQHHFLAVLGTSGSGKSSLIRAGLIPALKSGFMTKKGSNWEIVVCRIGDDPILSLAKKLNQRNILHIEEPQAQNTQNSILKVKLERSDNALANVVKESRMASTDNLLIVVDQFEEIFQHKAKGAKESAEATAFIKLLLEASTQKDSSIYIVLTMRSDFIGDCAEMPGLIEYINHSQYIVPRMTREQLRLAVSGPIKVGGGQLSSDLEKRLLNDIDDNPDHLPILQHAMMRMWDFWQSQTENESLDLYHYEAIGTMERALSMHAEEAYHELQPHQRQTAKILFQSITERRGDQDGVRKPSLATQIAHVAGTRIKDLEAVTDNFKKSGRSFLVTYGETEGSEKLDENTFIDISHESIMRLWDRLRTWVREEDESANAYLRLSHSAQMYEQGKSGLLQDPELSLALRWHEQQKPSSEWAERYDDTFARAEVFLLKSAEEKEALLAQKEATQKKTLKKAKIVALIFGFLSIVSILFLVYAIVAQVQANENLRQSKIQQKKAEDSRKLALKEREKAMASEQEAFEQKEKAIDNERFAKEQSIIAKQNELKAIENEKLALENEKIAKEQTIIAKEQTTIAINNEKKAVESEKKAVENEKLAKAEKERADTLRMRTLAKTLAASSIRVIEEEQKQLKGLLALQGYSMNENFGGVKNDPEVYEALFLANQAINESEQSILNDHDTEVATVSFSPDKKYYASGGLGGTISIREVQGDKLGNPKIFDACGNARCGVRDIVFNANNTQQFASAHQDNSVRLWDMTNKKPHTFSGHNDIVKKVLFSPDGKKLFSADVSGKILVWSTENLGQLAQIIDVGNRITDMQLTPAGNEIYISDEAGNLSIYNLAGEPQGKIAQNLGKVLAFTFDNTRNRLVLGSNQGKIIFVDLKSKKQVDYLEHKSGITGLAINPQGTKLATVSFDKSMKIFDLADIDKSPIELKANGFIYDISFSPDGQFVLFSSADGKVRKAATDTDLLAKNLCNILQGKSLSEHEWNRFVGNDIKRRKGCE